VSDKILADKVTLEELKDLLNDLYPEKAIEEECLLVVNKNGLHMTLFIDEADKIIRWLSTAKIKKPLTELELARLCKKYNDQDKIICCSLSYDIDNDLNSILIAFTIDLAFKRGLSVTQFFDTVLEYEWSCMTVIEELIEEGLLDPQDL
jgi:hypothetical protein